MLRRRKKECLRVNSHRKLFPDGRTSFSVAYSAFRFPSSEMRSARRERQFILFHLHHHSSFMPNFLQKEKGQGASSLESPNPISLPIGKEHRAPGQTRDSKPIFGSEGETLCVCVCMDTYTVHMFSCVYIYLWLDCSPACLHTYMPELHAHTRLPACMSAYFYAYHVCLHTCTHRHIPAFLSAYTYKYACPDTLVYMHIHV